MNDYRACTGCGICVLPCPVWQETRDLSLTLAGRALALQGGATALDLRESLEACVTCGACEPVCPVVAIFAEDAVPDDETEYIEINKSFDYPS